MIYFDNKKIAYAFEIASPICTISDEKWAKYAGTDKWDIINGVFTDITDTKEYKEKEFNKRKKQFEKDFFNTSLGWIRRNVTMKNGNKDFLSDLLPTISMAATTGQEVKIIAYNQPPFDKDVEDWTKYQHNEIVTPQFIQECFQQLQADFGVVNQ